MKFKFGLYAILLFGVYVGNAADLKVEQIRKAIEKTGAKWTAEENKITRLSTEERSFLTGAIPILKKLCHQRAKP